MVELNSDDDINDENDFTLLATNLGETDPSMALFQIAKNRKNNVDSLFYCTHAQRDSNTKLSLLAEIGPV